MFKRQRAHTETVNKISIERTRNVSKRSTLVERL